MRIYRALNLDVDKGELVSLVGGGGKTTTLFKLARELKELNKKVLITTTTAIYNPEGRNHDHYFLGDIGDFSPEKGSITIFGDRVEGGKLRGTPPQNIEKIMERRIFDFILIEADGAKEKPIKGHAPYEPVIPKDNTKVIGIIGLDALNKRIGDTAHRAEIFAEITNSNCRDMLDEKIMVKYIMNPKGIFKDGQGERILLLNKAHNERTMLQGARIRRLLLAKGYKGVILIADIRSGRFY